MFPFAGSTLKVSFLQLSFIVQEDYVNLQGKWVIK